MAVALARTAAESRSWLSTRARVAGGAAGNAGPAIFTSSLAKAFADRMIPHRPSPKYVCSCAIGARRTACRNRETGLVDADVIDASDDAARRCRVERLPGLIYLASSPNLVLFQPLCDSLIGPVELTHGVLRCSPIRHCPGRSGQEHPSTRWPSDIPFIPLRPTSWHKTAQD